MSESTKNKLRLFAKQNPGGAVLAHKQGRKPKTRAVGCVTSVCNHCNMTFEHKVTQKRVYCSRSCSLQHAGGYKPNSTRVHKSIYNGFVMDSGAEHTFARCLDEANIRWIKNTTTYFEFINTMGKLRKYYPDFFLPELEIWVEIKGKKYVRSDDHLRYSVVPNHILIMSTDLKKCNVKSLLNFGTSRGNRTPIAL